MDSLSLPNRRRKREQNELIIDPDVMRRQNKRQRDMNEMLDAFDEMDISEPNEPIMYHRTPSIQFISVISMPNCHDVNSSLILRLWNWPIRSPSDSLWKLKSDACSLWLYVRKNVTNSLNAGWSGVVHFIYSQRNLDYNSKSIVNQIHQKLNASVSDIRRGALNVSLQSWSGEWCGEIYTQQMQHFDCRDC